jgi:Rieske Fe-S protein
VYRAFDRTCTLWPEHNAAVVDDTLALKCPVCGSAYLPSLDGSVISGPAVYPLVEYHATLQNDVLHVYN